MNNSVTINKVETVTTVYTSYEILEVKVIPFQSCAISILLSSDNGLRKIINLRMDGEDYTNWNDDDQYLIDWINTQLTKS